MTACRATFLVDVLDGDGFETGRVVPVEIAYVRSVDKSYGADADGRRGVERVEFEILDTSIAPQHFVGMRSDEVEQVLTSAREMLLEGRQKPISWEEF